MSHTPGPWTYQVDPCRECEEKGEAEYYIPEIPGAYHAQFNHEDDARLIAAAPELLSWAQDAFAKQNCVCKLNPFVDGPVPCQTCQLGSLIAKATGGAQ